MRPHNQSINATSLWSCVRPKNILEFRLIRSCFSQADLERFSVCWASISFVEMYFKNTTDGLDPGEVWNPAISSYHESLQIRMVFLTQFSKKFSRTYQFLFHIFCEIKHHVIRIYFHNWNKIATREDDFRKVIQPPRWILYRKQTSNVVFCSILKWYASNFLFLFEHGSIGPKDILSLYVDGFRMRVMLFPKKRSETCRDLK